MSTVTLERSRIRLLKQSLRDALEQRNAAHLVLSRAEQLVEEGQDWRNPEVLSSDWPALLETTRFIRGISSHMRSPRMALTRFQSLLSMDESQIRRQLGELTKCLSLSDSSKVFDEFSAFWGDVCQNGPDPEAVWAAARSGEAPPLPEVEALKNKRPEIRPFVETV